MCLGLVAFIRKQEIVQTDKNRNFQFLEGLVAAKKCQDAERAINQQQQRDTLITNSLTGNISS